MDSEQVLEFLRKIAEQLGPVGQQAFHVVAARVVAESIIQVVAGIVILLFAAITGTYMIRWAKNYKPKDRYDDDAMFVIACGIGIWVFGVIISSIIIIPSAIDLLSIEYATIERILSLVKGN